MNYYKLTFREVLKRNLLIFAISLLTFCAYSQFVDVNTSPSCKFKNEGFIEMIIDEDSINYPLPYSISWENLTTGDFEDNINMEDYEYTINNLFPGEYEINIYFNESCKYFIETEVEEIETEPLFFMRKPMRPTCGFSDGKITLFPKSGVYPYDFTWSNGATTHSIGSPPNTYFINNLPAGNYCVTITDQECGYAEFCVPVESAYPNVKIFNIEQIANCQIEPYDCTGQVSILVTGVINYTVEWLDPDRNSVGTGTTISNLCDPGSYLAIVTFSTECQPFVYEIIVPCCNDESSNFSLDLDVTQGCNNNNSIETIVTGGNPPYTYQWNINSQAANLYNIGNGEYHVTVTDSTGCMVQDSVILRPIERLEVVNACEGFFDGSITFRINNPSNCPVYVNYDFSICSDCLGYPLIEGDTSSQITLTLENLGGGIEYTYWVQMCGCTIPYTFTIPEDPWDKTYLGHIDHGDWTFECYYDLDCKETHIDTGEVSLATVDLNAEVVDCEGLFSKDCGQIDYFCGDEKIADRDIDAKVMRRMRAYYLAQTLGYDQSVIDGTLGGNPCDWISVCPNDPTCVHGTAHGDFGGHYLGEGDAPAGCVKFRCKIAGIISTSYTVCGLEYVPDYLAAYYDPSIPINLNLNLKSCKPIEKNVGELIMHLDSLSYDHPNDFFNSELYGFLLEHIVDERKWCATVKYCTSDYSLIDDNIDEVDCEPIVPPLQTGGPGPIDRACAPYQGEDSLFYVFCRTPCPDPRPGLTCSPQPKVFVDDYGSFDPVGFSENHPTHQLMARMEGPSQFNSFLPLKQNRNTYSVNAVYSDNGVKLLHQFSYDNWNPYEVSNLEYLYQDLDSSYAFGMIRDSQYNSIYGIVYGDVGEIAESKLESSTSLDLGKIWSNDSLHFISGNFAGTLKLDSQNLSSSLTNRFFLLNIDQNIDLNAIRQVNLNGWKVYVDEESGDLAFWSSTSQGLYVDGVLQSNVATREIITLNGASSSSTIRDINLILPSTMKLLEYKRGDAYSAYLIAGSGTITRNGSQIYNTSTAKLILLTINHLGGLNWVKDYTLSSIDTSETTIEIVDGDSIFVGLNISNNITIDGNTLTNLGDNDVVILGYSSSGVLILIDHYGSESDEIVKDLFYSNGVLYLGGEVDSKTFKRQIGNLDFVNFSPDFSQGYISYILIDDPVQSQSLLLNVDTSMNYSAETIVEVFPNPAKEQVNIRVDQGCPKVEVIIRNINGQIMSVKESDRESLRKGIVFDLHTIPNGIYFADVKSDCIKLISRPFIKAD